MKLTLQLRLVPDAEQAKRLLVTMERVNDAATFAARIGFDASNRTGPSPMTNELWASRIYL